MAQDNSSLPRSEIKGKNEDEIRKELTPYFIHIIWPVLIIAFIAKVFAPLP